MKNSKKILCGVLSALMLQGMVAMPASAAPDGAVVIDFDDMGGTVTSSEIKNGSGTAIARFEQRTNDTDIPQWEVVKNPTAESEEDKVLALHTETTTNSVKFWNYAGSANAVANKVLVNEINVMADATINNVNIGYGAVDRENNKSANFYASLLKSSKNGYTPTYHYNKKDYAEVKNGTWTNYKIVIDGRNGADYGGHTISFYINGEMKYSETVNEMVTAKNYPARDDGTPYELDFFMFCLNVGQDKTTKPTVYFDNWKQYFAGDTTEFTISDYSNYVVEYGKKLRFTTDSYVGADMGYLPVNRVEYYDNNTKIGESTTAPFDLYYAPSGSGKHTITAKGYIDVINATKPQFTSSTSVLVEPQYRETVLTEADFEKYNGETQWIDAENNKWNISGTTTDLPPEAVEVDKAHGKSLSLGKNSGRALTLYKTITEGTIKVSGEYYFNSAGPNNTMFIFNNDVTDVNSLRVHGGMDLLDVVNSNTVVGKLLPKRWYKFDVITTIKNGQGYYSLYVDGKRVSQEPYNFTVKNGPTYTSLNKTNKIVFLASYNENAEIYMDNLSVSKIEYFEDTGFFDGETEVSSISEMAGTVLTAKTQCQNGNECTQYMAVYNKSTGKLEKIETGTYDSRTMTCTASCDLSGLENVYVKVFLWNDLMPCCETVNIQ